jgi:hypothetical protein
MANLPRRSAIKVEIGDRKTDGRRRVCLPWVIAVRSILERRPNHRNLTADAM